MRHIPRWLVFTAILVAVALASLSSLAVGTARRSLPQIEGELDLSVLSGPVEVLRDSHGVPHIYADNPEDLFAAQGFVNAQDRFYTMDVRRHLASGRLSELFGSGELATDTYVRTMGWRAVAEQELSKVSSSTRRYLDAYASGVNGYLRNRLARDISLEYSVLGVTGLDYKPEPWTAADSLAWLKALSWQLSANSGEEIEQAVMAGRVGEESAATLFPDYPLDEISPIVPARTGRGSSRVAPVEGAGAIAAEAQQALLATATATAAVPPLVAGVGGGAVGSNSWVVAGQRTDSGKPLLSNDPHLATSIPSVFTQVGLHCRTASRACPFDVSGFSFPGIPGVVIGRNARITWGMSNSYVDVQDLYLEEVHGGTVRYGNTYVPIQSRTEEIRVRGEDEPRIITVRSTRHGPLVSDVDTRLQRVGEAAKPPADATYAVALRWVALTPGRSMDAIFAINRAGSFEQFRAAAKLVTAPSQNVVYADVDGNIGYQLTGAVPVRGEERDGRTPAHGWNPAHEWRGTIPFEELPWSANPPAGYIVAANQPIVGPEYPRRLGSSYSYGWRSEQIIDRLEDAPPLTMDSSEQIFYDDTIRFAGDLVPLLLRLRVTDGWVAEGQRTLVGWDYTASADSAAAAYFSVVFHNVLQLTFHDQMPPELWPTGGDRWYAVVAKLLQEPDSVWWDDVNTAERSEDRNDILLAAMTEARKEITSLMSRDTDGWQWGKLHTARLRHPSLGRSGNPLLETLFNRGGAAVGGGPGAVNAMGYNELVGYGVVSGPAMRMLVDLSAPDGSRWVNQSGASGHAFAETYDDQLPLWAGNQMLPFVFSRPAVESTTSARLQLVPGG